MMRVFAIAVVTCIRVVARVAVLRSVLGAVASVTVVVVGWAIVVVAVGTFGVRGGVRTVATVAACITVVIVAVRAAFTTTIGTVTAVDVT